MVLSLLIDIHPSFTVNWHFGNGGGWVGLIVPLRLIGFLNVMGFS